MRALLRYRSAVAVLMATSRRAGDGLMPIGGGGLVAAVHRLAQAAGVRRSGGSLQRQRSKSSGERDQQQQSGGQVLHDLSAI